MPLKPGEVDLGTSIMAVKFANGVILAADTRTSTGIYVANRASDKLTPLHDRVFCCRSGSAADTQAMADIVRTQVNSHAIQIGRAPTVKTVATIFEKLCYDYKDRLSASVIVAGVDDIRGPSVYAIPMGGGLIEQDFVISGSGSVFMSGFCDSNYRPGMTEEEAVKFARTAIALAIHRDGSSGGNIRTMVITAEGRKREYLPGNMLPFPPQTGEEI